LRPTNTIPVIAAALLIGACVLLLAPAPPAGAADACTTPDQPLRPIAATHTIPPYPSLSQMTAEQGTTTLQVAIGKDGAVTDAQVFKSSGSLRLDEAALEHVKANWRWQPPIKDCQTAEATTRVSIAWNLRESPGTTPAGVTEWTPDAADYPSDSLSRHEQGVVGVIIALSNTGEVAGTRIAISSGFPNLDDKAVQLAKSRKWTPAQMNGKPVATMVELAVEWKLPGQETGPK